MSKYSHLYLGSGSDPSPVFRDLSPEGVRLPGGPLVHWLDGAVFAVYFSRDSFPTFSAEVFCDTPAGRLDFYAQDGWPLGFPEARKSLLQEVRREVQVSPWHWRAWDSHTWKGVSEAPWSLRRCRLQAAFSQALVPSVH